MAISKSVLLPNGQTATYWRVTNVYVSGDNSNNPLASVRAFILGYTSASGTSPVYAQEIVLQGQQNPLNAGQIERLLENALVSNNIDPLLQGGTVV